MLKETTEKVGAPGLLRRRTHPSLDRSMLVLPEATVDPVEESPMVPILSSAELTKKTAPPRNDNRLARLGIKVGQRVWIARFTLAVRSHAVSSHGPQINECLVTHRAAHI